MERRADKRAKESVEAQLLKELKKCVSEARFSDALGIIEQIDVNKIKVAPNLCLIGEVYMHEGMYDAAERVFVRAYDKSPSNRRILSLLTSLYIEMGDYGEAEYYYKEFIGVATRDLNRYILRYRLDRAKGERKAVLIDTLERLKDYEYIEEWAYELAELYHKAGEEQKAVHECDEIVLWFGHGEFVNKAVRLKCEITGEAIPVFDEDFMSAYEAQPEEEAVIPVHTGITETAIDVDLIEQALKAQEEQNQQFREKQEKYVSSEDILAGGKVNNEPSETHVPDALENTGKISEMMSVNKETDIKENDEADDFFDIFEEGKSEAAQTMVEADMTEEGIPIPEGFGYYEEKEVKKEQVEDDLPMEETPAQPPTIGSIFDALSTDTVQDFWGEKERRRSKRAFKKRSVEEIEKEQREAEVKKAQLAGLQVHEDAINQLVFAKEDEDEDDFEDEIFEPSEFGDDLLSEDDFEDEIIEEGEEADTLFGEDDFADALFSDEFDDKDAMGEEPASKTMIPDVTAPILNLFAENIGKEVAVDSENVGEEVAVDSENIVEEVKEEVVEFDEDDFEDEVIPETKVSSNTMELIMDEEDIVEERVWTEEDKSFISGLFDDSKTSSDLFAQVPNLDYVKEQLTMTFTKFEDTATQKFDILAAYDINFVVLADDKSMKSQIALGIAKALNTYGKCDKTKIVRAKARDLNRMNFSTIFDKIKGGCLIIEKADLLSDASAKIIEDYVNQDNQETAIVFASIEDEIMKFWKKHQTLRSKFLNVINVEKYNEMELVTLAKGYVEQRKYELDPEAALVLRDYFKKCLDSDQEVNYEDVMGIVDEAISNLEKRNVKNLFMTVLDNKYEEAKMFKLIAEDFKMLK